MPTYNMSGDENTKNKETTMAKKRKQGFKPQNEKVNPERLDIIRTRTKKKAIANIGKNPYFGTFTVDHRIHDATDCMRHFKNFREGCFRRLGWVPPYIMTIAETDDTHRQHIHILLLDTTPQLLEQMPKLWTVGDTKLNKIPEVNRENHIRACINYIYKNVEVTLRVNPKIRRTIYISKNLKKPNRTEVFTQTELSSLISKLYAIQEKYNLDIPTENIVKTQDRDALHIGFRIPKDKYRLMKNEDVKVLLSAQALNIDFFRRAINGKLSHSDYYLILNHLYTKDIYKVYLKEAYNIEYPDISDLYTQKNLKDLITEVYNRTQKLPDINKLTSKEAIREAWSALTLDPKQYFKQVTKTNTKKQLKSANLHLKELDKLYNKLKNNLWTKYQNIFVRFSEKLLDILVGFGYIIKR